MRGVDLAFKAENPKGQRIERLFLEGRPANDGTVYAVSFITEQGVPARFGKNRRQLPVDAIAALRKRLARPFTHASVEIGRASCRERVCQYGWISRGAVS